MTVAEVLKGMGYRTVALVTNPNLFRGIGFEQGFDEYYQVARPTSYLPAEGVLEFFFRWVSRQEETPPQMFFFVHLMDPHIPYLKPEERNPLFRRFNRQLYEKELIYFDGIIEKI